MDKTPIKIMLIAGARPNFMKIASIVEAIKAHNASQVSPPIQVILVHTGQHYGEKMSEAFFKDLGMPQPDVDLEVGSASHAQQTAEIMKRFEAVLLKEHPDALLVVGDVNSTVACSLVAAKIVYPASVSAHEWPRLAHVEAGLRSFDRTMPEEVNRILTDALADFLFVTEQSAVENLSREGVPKEKIFLVGNTMVDTLLRHRARAQQSAILERLGLASGADSRASVRFGDAESGAGEDYAVLTLHRPSNVDDACAFREILSGLAEVAERLPVLLPVHPRTANRIRQFQLEHYFHFVSDDDRIALSPGRIHCIEPLGYLDFLCLMSNAKLVLTDSGGIQEETTVLGIPCVTLRKNTERPVTLSEGTNVLAGTSKEDIIHYALSQLEVSGKHKTPEYWDGKAGERIVRILVECLQKS